MFFFLVATCGDDLTFNKSLFYFIKFVYSSSWSLYVVMALLLIKIYFILSNLCILLLGHYMWRYRHLDLCSDNAKVVHEPCMVCANTTLLLIKIYFILSNLCILLLGRYMWRCRHLDLCSDNAKVVHGPCMGRANIIRLLLKLMNF